jgi:hypothetical protein
MINSISMVMAVYLGMGKAKLWRYSALCCFLSHLHIQSVRPFLTCFFRVVCNGRVVVLWRGRDRRAAKLGAALLVHFPEDARSTSHSFERTPLGELKCCIPENLSCAWSESFSRTAGLRRFTTVLCRSYRQPQGVRFADALCLEGVQAVRSRQCFCRRQEDLTTRFVGQLLLSVFGISSYKMAT